MRNLTFVLILIMTTATLGFGQASPAVSVDPCFTNTSKSSVVINIGSATTTQLVALVAGQKIYVCGYSATHAVGTAATYQFEYGTGSSCGTGTTVLTGAMIGGFFVSFADPGTTFATPAGNALCMVTAGTGPSAQGVLTYIQQ